MQRFFIQTALSIYVCCAGALSAGSFSEDVRRDTAWLAGYDSRVPGTAGHQEAQAELLKRVRAVRGARVWTQEFQVLIPLVTKGELLIEQGSETGSHTVYPVWPDLVRLKTTPEEGISGRLIYVGSASLSELPARSLRGQIAVMEMSAYDNWKRPFSMGAAAVLLLGSPDDLAVAPAQQALFMPRYYVREGALADALRSGQVAAATIHCDAEWADATARNIYALVKPTVTHDRQLPPVALTAPYDAMSIIMGLAPGADNAVDAAFLLNLLRALAQAPADRAVLFCFVDAVGCNQSGMRRLLSMLTVVPEDGTRQAYEKQDAESLEIYRELADQVERLGDGRAALELLHDKSEYRELQRYIKDEVAAEILQLREELAAVRLEMHEENVALKARAETNSPALSALQDVFDKKMSRTREINTALAQVLTKAEIVDEWVPMELDIWHRVRQRVSDQLAELEAYASRFEGFDKLRSEMAAEMGTDSSVGVPVSAVIGLDLSDAGVSLGPALYDGHLLVSQAASAREFTDWMKTLIKTPGDPFWRAAPHAERIINIESLTGHDDPESFNVGKVGVITSPAESFKMPAVTWTTLEAMRRRVDTPQDRAERLDWSRLNPQIDVTRQLLWRLLNDAGFAPKLEERLKKKPMWRQARGVVVSESVAETIPRTPMPGFMVTLVGGSKVGPGPAGAPGIRRHEFLRSGRDGMFRFSAMPGVANGSVNVVNAKGFALDARGRIVRSVSDGASMIAARASSFVNLSGQDTDGPARIVAFECVEVNGPEFFDPRFLEPLSQFSLIDVTFGGTPKEYHFSVHDGQMFGLLKANTVWQLLLRAGSVGNRMTLLNLDRNFPAQGDLSLRAALNEGGFSIADALQSIPSHVSAIDLFTIDEWRMDRFSKAGIASKVIDALHATTADLLERADGALENDDGPALQRYAASGLSNEIRAYEAVRAMGDDVTRGAIFLMILLVPFSVAMERLLFACRRIGMRIFTSFSVFAGMTTILWSFHPSFRITSQPMIIVMAFAVLALSLVVIVMILRKFEADMEQLRRGHAEASGAQTERSGLIGSAVWLGIANMRKRKMRTMLTASTIVLITFALLCFSSSTHYQNRRQFAIHGVDAPYAGVLVRQPSMRKMHPRALETVQGLLAGGGDVVARYWWPTSGKTAWRLHVRNPLNGKQASIKAGLGLEAREGDLTRVREVLPHWERFSEGGACYVSTILAGALSVTPGDSIVIAGQSLELAGTFDAQVLANTVKMLDGQSLLPYDYTVELEGGQSTEAVRNQLAAGMGLAPETDVSVVSGDEVIILPAEFTRQAGGELRSMVIQTASGALAEETALELMKVLAFPMYYGEGRDVKVVVATPLIPRPPRNLLIPLIIAALIIFNTMLNSVAERKKEIHIYTSLGLAPRHVAILFLAESATYGLMGSVFGYVVGQGLAKVLTAFDLMGGITLNYSGSNVVMTMGMVMAVVLLSAIVPALMARKLATPSDDMKWTVPEPVDGVISEWLPFTVSRAAAGGLVAFIYDFLDAHTDGGIGKFTADALEVLPPEHHYVAGVRATTWLSPYDLGVRQKVQIEVIEDVEDICNIRVDLTYGTGQPRSWWRLNRTFLDELRRQLLGWRNIDPERVMAYIEEADRNRPPPAVPEVRFNHA